MLPNLFIVGAMKCRTTSIFNMLAQAPGVNTCASKEPNHFCTDLYSAPDFRETAGRLKSRTPSWVADRQAYLALFPQERVKWLAEASVAYLYSETAAEEIRRFNPDARIIISLRNPVSRAYSEYLMCREVGLTTVSFSEAIRRDHAIMRAGKRPIYERYVRSGMYANQVERYLAQFPRKNIFVDIMDQPGNDLENLRARLANFLDIPIPPFHQNANSARRVRAPLFNFLLFQIGLKTYLSEKMPQGMRRLLQHAYYSDHVDKSISKADREFLKEIFFPDADRLSRLLGENVGFWFAAR